MLAYFFIIFLFLLLHNPEKQNLRGRQCNMFFFGIHDDTQLGTVVILDNETYPSLTVL